MDVQLLLTYQPREVAFHGPHIKTSALNKDLPKERRKTGRNDFEDQNQGTKNWDHSNIEFASLHKTITRRVATGKNRKLQNS
jgi:hypothetical protein